MRHLNPLSRLLLAGGGGVAATGCAKKAVTPPPAPPAATPTPAPTPTPTPAVTPPAPTTGLPLDQATLGKLQTVYFALDSDAIDESAQAALDANAALLKTTIGDFVIEGHCDERGTAEYNQALGERRAQAVRQFLADQGIALSRMSVISYGKDRPAVEGHDESAWSKNRRAQFSLR